MKKILILDLRKSEIASGSSHLINKGEGATVPKGLICLPSHKELVAMLGSGKQTVLSVKRKFCHVDQRLLGCNLDRVCLMSLSD